MTPFARPVVVSFEEDHAREEVLQKSGMLKGSNVYITEDLSRWRDGCLYFTVTLIFVQIHSRHEAGAGEVHEGGEEEQPRGGGEAGLRHG